MGVAPNPFRLIAARLVIVAVALVAGIVGVALALFLLKNVTHHAGIVHLTGTIAVCNFLPQVR